MKRGNGDRTVHPDYVKPEESGFSELLTRHLRAYRSSYRETHGKDISFSEIAEHAGITGRAFRDIRYGIEKPKRQTTINLGRAFGLGAEEIDILLLTAGHEPKGDLSPAYIEDTSFESRAEKLYRGLKERCEPEIQKCEEKISYFDTQFLGLSKEESERGKEYYKKRIEKARSKMVRFNALRENFRKLMKMTDEELYRNSSNDRIDLSDFPEELREGIKRRELFSYNEFLIRTGELTFGKLLRQYRDGITTGEFGKMVPIDPSYLRRIEKDLRRPSETKARSIATALGLDEEKTIQLLKLARNL